MLVMNNVSKMFVVKSTFFALLLVVLLKYVCRNKSLTGLMLPNIVPKI